ncbi:GTPase IMAP family member 4-like isoform X2 [Ctenopharyngodon idella]|uniref:GTPase IMAP family member 4-like isoform X2 n=1 Tax=Ctenopharyngodon idella TaxID=7959 RepID=UPI00222F4555|nr:GTPase IMAP family member 4-like isoform X2 [Ctenopharyngodon idella]
MARRRDPKARGDDFETKTPLLDESNGEYDDADNTHTAHAGPSTVADNQENPSTTCGTQYGTFTEAAGHTTDSIKNMRFIVLGSDNSLMNKVPEFILGQRCMRSGPGICELREDHVQDRHVSVVITPVNWLERLKSFWFFKNAVKELKKEMEFSESLVFPGPHAFLLVIDGQSNKEHLLLDAVREVFGQKALDYSMVLFINACPHNSPKDNLCVKTCGNRHYILYSTRQSVAGLFVEVERMIRSKKCEFFTNHFEFFKKCSVHLQNELKTEYEKKESELLRKLTEMNKTVQNQQKKIRDLKTEVRLKDAMLQEESHKRKALEQKLTEAGAEQALLTRRQPRTAQRQEVHKDESEEEIEAREEDLQASGLQKFEGLKTVKRDSKDINPPNSKNCH